MPSQSTKLFLLQDLENSSKTSKLADSDLSALHRVADWIRTFVARPNKDLGRAGPVCPFVPGACERETLWLAPERIADRSVSDVVQLMNGYKKLLLRAQPIEGDDTSYKAIVVIAGLPPGQHKVKIQLVDANHNFFPGQVVTLTFTVPDYDRAKVYGHGQ